jgi:hypothetical protein
MSIIGETHIIYNSFLASYMYTIEIDYWEGKDQRETHIVIWQPKKWGIVS